jgi:hypothetical protein
MSSGLGRFVTELSTRFTGLPVEQIDEEIERPTGLRPVPAGPPSCRQLRASWG